MRRPQPLAAAAFLFVAATAAACAPAPSGDGAAATPQSAADVGLDNLNATLWVQTATEYRGTSLQAYALGARVLDEALADPDWTAFLGQTGDYQSLPPAVILDIDETVLDNSYYEARLVLDHASYSTETWDQWVLQEASTAIPGAVEFIKYATSKGVGVFYVTNRRAHLEDATRNNFATVGIPIDDARDTLLMRGERPEWEDSDKTPRWQTVAAGHRILIMFGDNMGDLTAAETGSIAERRTFAAEHTDYYGTKWITLANPTYGSFIDAALDHDRSLTAEQQIDRKRAALDPKR